MKDLTENEYTKRIYINTFRENTKPGIYYLTSKSRKILKEQGIEKLLLDKLYREKLRSRLFIDQCIFIAEIYLSFLSVSESNNLHFYTKTELIKFPYLIYPLPHAYIAIEDSGQVIKRYFLEIIDGSTPRFVVRNRIQQYIDYYSENKWSENTSHPFPAVLLICPDEQSQKYIYKHIKTVLEEDISDVNFHLTTKESIKLHGVAGQYWQKVE